jgi:2-dehydro-3-deoxy-D-arabinonate dehydratase
MRIAKFRRKSNGEIQIGVVGEGFVRPLDHLRQIRDLLFAENPRAVAEQYLADNMPAIAFPAIEWLPPIDDQEVWGAGVTYQRSKEARQEESEQGGSFYDLVYKADRPELFFKATPNRVAGPNQPVCIRNDTRWAVPEPELALALDPRMRIVGFTIGNDMSARDIEGRNPLYLPQAKVYEGCCALGPWVTLATAVPDPLNLRVELKIERNGQVVTRDETSTSKMARTLQELVDWLGRDNVFPTGAYLLTGTGIVPPDDFCLQAGDLVAITIEGLGTLENPVRLAGQGS